MSCIYHAWNAAESRRVVEWRIVIESLRGVIEENPDYGAGYYSLGAKEGGDPVARREPKDK
jgi:hypothetical protein